METAEKYFLQPGYIFVCDEPHHIHTVLGSCVAVCLWDSVLKIGGMNHYVHSRAENHVRNCRFGDVSTTHLINLMLEMGCKRENLMAHIVGGGCNPQLSSEIGRENAKVAEEILKKNKIKIVTKDIEGQMGRKVVFDTQSGEILVYKVTNIRKSDWW